MTTPDEGDLMVQIARLHYLEGLTKVEIADRLAISRFKVARFLELALATGIVTITIRPPGLTESELSGALVSRFGLAAARVVPGAGATPETLRDRLGQVGAALLADVATRTDVLGFDSGRTVTHIADYLTALPPCDVVQLSGLAGSVRNTGLDILRRVTEISGGTVHPLYAPMLAPDPTSAAALRREPVIARTIEQYDHVTIAVVSVGSWNPPLSQVYDRLTPAERRDLLAAGVVAETCALMFTADGQPVTRLDDQRLGISLDALRRVPNVITVAGGTEKAGAIRALLQADLIDTLVTDSTVARLLLDPDGEGSGVETVDAARAPV